MHHVQFQTFVVCHPALRATRHAAHVECSCDSFYIAVAELGSVHSVDLGIAPKYGPGAIVDEALVDDEAESAGALRSSCQWSLRTVGLEVYRTKTFLGDGMLARYRRFGVAHGDRGRSSSYEERYGYGRAQQLVDAGSRLVSAGTQPIVDKCQDPDAVGG